MSNANWRGIVGVIKPTYKSGSLVDFIHLLPDGVGVMPLFIGAHEHSENEYLRAMEIYHRRVGELAQIGVDLIHPEGGPPFMVRGVQAPVRNHHLGADRAGPTRHITIARAWRGLSLGFEAPKFV